jgi:hypothetical protein
MNEELEKRKNQATDAYITLVGIDEDIEEIKRRAKAGDPVAQLLLDRAKVIRSFES